MDHRDSKSEEDQADTNVKQDKPMLDDKDLENDHNKTKFGSDASEDKRQLASTDGGASEKSIPSNEQATINHGRGLDNCNDPGNSKVPNDQALGTLHNSVGPTSKAEISPSSEEVRERTSNEEPCHPMELKDGTVSDSHPSEKKELQQSIKSNSPGEHPKPVETPKYDEMVSDSMPSDKSKPLSTNPVCESQKTTDSVMDVDVASNSLPSEKIDSQPPFTPISSHNGTQKDVDMMSPSHPIRSNSGAENGASTGWSLSLFLSLIPILLHKKECNSYSGHVIRNILEQIRSNSLRNLS